MANQSVYLPRTATEFLQSDVSAIRRLDRGCSAEAAERGSNLKEAMGV